jgi:hypothetical protein
MATLLELTRETVRAYATRGLNSKAFALLDDEQGYYAVNTVSYPERKRPMGVMVMARVVDGQVIIEVDELVAAGIPRERIILAYIGEAPPQSEN